MTTVATLQSLARALGVAYSTVRRWKREGLRPERDGTWSTDRALAWRQARGDGRSPEGAAIPTGNQVGGDHPQWRDEIAKLRANRLAFEVAALQRGLVRSEHVEAAFRARAAALDRLLAALARRVSRRGAGASEGDLQAIVHDETRAMVHAFSAREGLAEIARRADSELAGFEPGGDD